MPPAPPRLPSLLILLICGSLTGTGCGDASGEHASSTAKAKASPAIDLQEVGGQVQHFCGACHLTPRPVSFPRERWRHEVERGYEFYLLSARTDLRMPRRSDVIQYYEELAPQRLALPEPPQGDLHQRFERASYQWEASSPGGPAAAHILALPAETGDALATIAMCDMGSGAVDWLAVRNRRIVGVRTAALRNPDHICQTDLDGDGQADYLVADLGSFLPEDHNRGSVVWLRPRDGNSEQIVLLDGVGRVADAQAADFDGDGQLDIMAAVFGWQTTGGLVLLRQTGREAGMPTFSQELLDSRHGAIHVCPGDVNADGRLDAVVLFAQEHETIVAFLGQADGSFAQQVVYQAPDPSYGSTGIQLVDLDGDGDLDVVYSNGDMLDSDYLKPYHGIRWLENRGGEWIDHPIMQLPGVHRVLAGDLDGDGDLDLAACCFVPASARDKYPAAASLASLVWIERQGDRFRPHGIEFGNGIHATLELADINGDGTLDIIVGNFDPSRSGLQPFDVWLNRGER